MRQSEQLRMEPHWHNLEKTKYEICLSEDLCVGLSGWCVIASWLRQLWRCFGPFTASPLSGPQCSVGVLASPQAGWHREHSASPLWLCCVGGCGLVMWTSLIHAFFEHTEVTLLSLRFAPWRVLRPLRLLPFVSLSFSRFVACLTIVQVLCCLTPHVLELHHLDEICNEPEYNDTTKRTQVYEAKEFWKKKRNIKQPNQLTMRTNWVPTGVSYFHPEFRQRITGILQKTSPIPVHDHYDFLVWKIFCLIFCLKERLDR